MATPAVDRQAEQRLDPSAREPVGRQPDRDGGNGAPAGLDARSLLTLQSTAGNAAVASLLSRASSLPPGPLLTSLGGVAAAMTRACRREQDALAAAPPSFTAAADAPDAPAAIAPISLAAPIAPPTEAAGMRDGGPPQGDRDSAELQKAHSAFDQTLAAEARSEALGAARPAGEQTIVAESGPAPIMAAVPTTASPAGPLIASSKVDEGVSLVAKEERGAEVRQAAIGGSAAVAALTAAHEGRQAEARERSVEELETLEKENRSRRDAERGAAVEGVASIRQEWGDERRRVVTETGAQGRAAGKEAAAAIARHRAEAERAAAAARDEGKRESGKTQGQAQGGGGVLGALASAARSLATTIGQAATTVLQGAERLAEQALEKGKQLVRATVAAAAQSFGAAITRGRSLLAAARDRFRQAIAERVARARAAVTSLMSGLGSAARRTLDAAALARSASIQVLQAGWQAALAGVRATVQGAIDFARKAIAALGAFAPIVRDVVSNPGQWLANLAAGARDGIRNHLWPELQQAVREWFDDKVQSILGLGATVWGILLRGGITLAQVGHVLWEGIKAAIPPTLISILIEKLVSLLVPAAAAALLIVQAIQAAWGSLSRILQAFDAFMRFLRAVRSGSAGPPFGKALAAGAVALLDFVSNFLLQRLGGPIKKAASRFKALSTVLSGSVGREWHSLALTTRLTILARTRAHGIREGLRSAAALSDGSLVGLGHEFKSFGSLHRKVRTRLALGGSPEKVATGIKDAARYTIVFDAQNYAASARSLLANLKSRGFRAIDYDNRWAEGKAYVGINLGYIAPSGQRFELQLHTSGKDGSWHAKQFLTHGDYEKLRTTSDPQLQDILRERMIKANSHVAIPPGAREIPSPLEM